VWLTARPAALVLVFFTVPVLLLSAIDRYHIVSQFKQRERVVIIDPASTCYLSPLLQFSEAKDLHIQPAEFNSTERNIQQI
jgi:hypothetical protein